MKHFNDKDYSNKVVGIYKNTLILDNMEYVNISDEDMTRHSPWFGDSFEAFPDGFYTKEDGVEWQDSLKPYTVWEQYLNNFSL